MCLLLNKIDRIGKAPLRRMMRRLENIASKRENIISFSTISNKKAKGIDLMLNNLSSTIDSLYSPSSEPMITQLRYRTYLQECIGHLQDFSLDKPMEICGEDIRACIECYR